MGGKYRENASLDVARNVPGFDIVLMVYSTTPANARRCKRGGRLRTGDGPRQQRHRVSDIDITVTLRNGKVTDKQIDGVLRNRPLRYQR